MFDYLKIDHKWIPEDKRNTSELFPYQTKSFGCNMDFYIIDNDGTLWVMPRGGNGHTYQHICTGAIRFYDDYYEFVAWCVDGVVKEVVCVGVV